MSSFLATTFAVRNSPVEVYVMRPCAEPRKPEIMITIKCDCRENSFRNNGEPKRMVPSLLNLLFETKSRTHIFYPLLGCRSYTNVIWNCLGLFALFLLPSCFLLRKENLFLMLREKLRWKFPLVFLMCVHGGRKKTFSYAFNESHWQKNHRHTVNFT